MSCAPHVTPVLIRAGGAALEGDLVTAAGGVGTIVLAHGSHGRRASGRDRHVAHVLRSARLATLLVDLLTAEEAGEDAPARGARVDVALLTDRLTGVVEWARLRSPHPRPVGILGASVGAAAALAVAALRPDLVGVVVSRGGRPDPAAGLLGDVRAPTLLIVGGADAPAIRLNQEARALAADRPRGDAPVRGARRPRHRGRPGQRLVHAPSRHPGDASRGAMTWTSPPRST